jgi:hypothetical protein
VAVVSCEVATGEFSSMPIPGLDTEFEIPYNIITNAITDNAATIFATGCLNARFSPFPDNIFATLRRTSLKRDPKSIWSNAVWRAVEHYSSVPLTEKDEQQQVSPLDRPAEIDWIATPYQVPVLYGVGLESNDLIPPTYHEVMVPVVNSAGDQPDPIPEKTEYHWVANVTKNVSVVPAWVGQGYAGAVNSAAYVIDGVAVAAECSRLTDLRVSKKMKENDVRYRQISFSLEFRTAREQRTDVFGLPLVIAWRRGGTGLLLPVEDVPPPPFNLELPDMGLHKLDPLTGLRTRIMTDDAPPRPVSQPVMLNGSGDKLANPTPYNMILGNWRILKSKPFNVLPLT